MTKQDEIPPRLSGGEHVATFNGPVSIARFDDGTLIVAGPQDEPVLIRNGTLMKCENPDVLMNGGNGDLVFKLPFFIGRG